MWHKFSGHHAQQGSVTAVVWGSPGDVARGMPSGESMEEGAGPETEMVSSHPLWRCDAEEMTRGRRAETPFIQQCDLIFPVPVTNERSERSVGEDEEMYWDTAHAEAERRAQGFVYESLGGRSFFYRARGPLSALLSQDFLESCVLKKNFCALALNAPADQGNSWAIVPGGVLVLSLDRESFQTVGLPGEAARTRPKGNSKRAGAGSGCTGGGVGVLGGGAGGADRYISTFDLSSKSFRPGKPLHDRLLSCLGGSGKRRGGRGRHAGGTAEGGGATAEVDMVVCWWGDASEGDGDGGGDVQGEGVESETCAVNRGGESSAVSDVVGTNEHLGQKGRDRGTEPADDCDALNHRDGGGGDTGLGKDDGVENEGQQHQGSGSCCLQVKFPSAFSLAEKIELKPEISFFREACCPDLDLVGQGLVAPSSLLRSKDSSAPEGGKKASSVCGQTNVENASGNFSEKGQSPSSTQPAHGSVVFPPPFREQPSNSSFTPRGEPSITSDPREKQTDVAIISGKSAEFEGETEAHSVETPVAKARAMDQKASDHTKCLLMMDLFEWLGAVSCGLEAQLRRFPSPPEPHLSEFETPQHLPYRRPVGVDNSGGYAVCRARLRGLVAPPAVRTFVEAAGAIASGSGAVRGDESTSADVDGCAWGSVTAWPFQDAPSAYAAADAPCGGGERRKTKKQDSDAGRAQRAAKAWPVGGHGIYTVVACPGQTSAAFVSARCPGPGW